MTEIETLKLKIRYALNAVKLAQRNLSEHEEMLRNATPKITTSRSSNSTFVVASHCHDSATRQIELQTKMPMLKQRVKEAHAHLNGLLQPA
jgi:hypothetical protein